MADEQNLRIKAKRLPATSFDRSSDRYELEFEVSAQILIPEDTFHPRFFVGHCNDVSASGLKIVLDEIPSELYLKLLMKTRYIRVVFMNPATRNEVKITGKVMWIDYHKSEASSKSGKCFLGIYLEKGEGANLSEYQRLIESIDPL